MKKISLYLSIILIAGLTATAQKKDFNSTNRFRLDVGVAGGIPLGQFANIAKTGIGGYVQGGYNVSPNANAILNIGYCSFPGNTYSGIKLGDEHLFSVLAGGNFFCNKNVHIDIGIGFSSLTDVAGIMYRAGAGYVIDNRVDVTVNYNGIDNGLSLSYVGFGVAYKILK